MTWETEFDEFLTQQVKREPWSGQDDYGEPTFGPPSFLQARVVHKPELVISSVGEASRTTREVVSSAIVYFSGAPGWDTKDRITLPDGSQPIILEVRRYPDEDGNHHESVVV